MAEGHMIFREGRCAPPILFSKVTGTIIGHVWCILMYKLHTYFDYHDYSINNLAFKKLSVFYSYKINDQWHTSNVFDVILTNNIQYYLVEPSPLKRVHTSLLRTLFHWYKREINVLCLILWLNILLVMKCCQIKSHSILICIHMHYLSQTFVLGIFVSFLLFHYYSVDSFWYMHTGKLCVAMSLIIKTYTAISILWL